MATTRQYAPIQERLAAGRPVILDGAIGTEILRRDLTWADHQNLARPDVIRALHADYVRAGADVLSTNTFQLSRCALLNHFLDRAHMERIGVPELEARAESSLRAAVALADQARREATDGRPVAIAGAITTLE